MRVKTGKNCVLGWNGGRDLKLGLINGISFGGVCCEESGKPS
jgi:hypothetical protein